MVATALLQARRRFAAPAAAPLVNNLVVIAAYLCFARLRDGQPPSLTLSAVQVAVLAGGTTLGVVAFTAVPLVAAQRSRRAVEASAGAATRRWALWRARVSWAGVYLGLTQLLTLGVLVLGNGADGAVARFSFAFAFFQLPYALIAVPVATARFPAMATAALAGAAGRLARLVGDAVVTTVAGCALASAVMLALAWPLVRLTAFGEAADGDIGPLAHAVGAFAPGLIAYGLFYLLTRVRYAQGDVRSPTLANALVAISGLTTMALASAMTVDGERAAALAAAYGGAHLVGAVVLGVIAARSLPDLRRSGVGRAVLAAVLLGVAACLVMAGMADALGADGRAGSLATLVVSGLAGAAVFAVALPPASGRSWRILLGARDG